MLTRITGALRPRPRPRGPLNPLVRVTKKEIPETAITPRLTCIARVLTTPSIPARLKVFPPSGGPSHAESKAEIKNEVAKKNLKNKIAKKGPTAPKTEVQEDKNTKPPKKEKQDTKNISGKGKES